MPTSVPTSDDERDSQKPKARARHTCWTLNNWTAEELEAVRSYAAEIPRYMCWSQETCPTTGTPHLQGYVAWDNPRSLNKFKLRISPRLHYEPHTNGTAQQNRNYCLGMVEKKGFKENPTFEECGEIPQQGTRTDWQQALTHLSTGGDIPTVVAAQPQLLPCIRALERFQQISNKPLNRPVDVIILIGQPGTGKSRWAYDNYPDLYSKPEGQWFDGYTGQKTLLLDDYYGELPYSQLLKVCDRYPLQVPVKGGFVYAQWTTVIITSNKPIQFWSWPPNTCLDAFKRRITRHEEDYNYARQENRTSPPSPPHPPPPPPPSSRSHG